MLRLVSSGRGGKATLKRENWSVRRWVLWGNVKQFMAWCETISEAQGMTSSAWRWGARAGTRSPDTPDTSTCTGEGRRWRGTHHWYTDGGGKTLLVGLTRLGANTQALGRCSYLSDNKDVHQPLFICSHFARSRFVGDSLPQCFEVAGKRFVSHPDESPEEPHPTEGLPQTKKKKHNNNNMNK